MEKIRQYLNEAPETRGLSDNTRQSYSNALNHLKTYCYSALIKDLDGSFDMDRYAKHLAKTLSGQSVQLYLTITKQFFKWLGHPIEYTYRIPKDERKAIQLKKLDRWFSEDDVDACLGYHFPGNGLKGLRNRIIVRLLVETGARIKELSMIDAKDIDLDTGTITLKDSKTVPRPVFVSAETLSMLEDYINRTVAGIFETEGALFPSESQCSKVVNEMLVDLGLKNGSDERGPHTFRHYVATWLHYEGGMDIKDIAFLLGDKPDTIVNVYIHPTPDMLRRRVQKAMGW